MGVTRRDILKITGVLPGTAFCSPGARRFPQPRGRIGGDERASAEDGWGYQGIFHFTVEASNFERSLAFYQTLGFKLLRDNRDIIWPDYVAT